MSCQITNNIRYHALKRGVSLFRGVIVADVIGKMTSFVPRTTRQVRDYSLGNLPPVWAQGSLDLVRDER